MCEVEMDALPDQGEDTASTLLALDAEDENGSDQAFPEVCMDDVHEAPKPEKVVDLASSNGSGLENGECFEMDTCVWHSCTHMPLVPLHRHSDGGGSLRRAFHCHTGGCARPRSSAPARVLPAPGVGRGPPHHIRRLRYVVGGTKRQPCLCVQLSVCVIFSPSSLPRGVYIAILYHAHSTASPPLLLTLLLCYNPFN